jgi:hypothetical protein
LVFVAQHRASSRSSTAAQRVRLRWVGLRAGRSKRSGMRRAAREPHTRSRRNMMKIVAIGGTRLIGSKVVRHLRERGQAPASAR